MQYWYSAQLRQYRLQFIRAFSNFSVMTGTGVNGTSQLVRVPCQYGDPSRVAANIVRGNSENKILPTPFITCYISSLAMAPERRTDPQLTRSIQVNERKYDGQTGAYTNEIGNRYTVERYMPVPYNLTMQVDIWTNNLDIKEQLLEQILVLYNPAIDVQTSTNPLDWTVLTTITMKDNIVWTSRSIPVGTDNPIDVASMSFEIPIWINPPAKVKKQSIIQEIITNIVEGSIDSSAMEWNDYQLLSRNITTPENAVIKVVPISGNDYSIYLCDNSGNQHDDAQSPTVTQSINNPALRTGMAFTWNGISCYINHNDLPSAVNDIRECIAGSELNCLLFNDTVIQLINTAGTDNTFENLTSGTVEAFGLQPITYPGGNLAWWRLLMLYGNLKTYSAYGATASQLRIKTVNDIEQTSTDVVGWIDIDPADQNRIIWHTDPQSMPNTTLPAINAIVDPQQSGPGINLPVSASGQRYLLTDTTPIGGIWGDIAARSNDIIEFNGTSWIVSWSASANLSGTQYILNNRSGIIYNWSSEYWAPLITSKCLPGYWTLSI